MVITMAKLRMAHASTHGARKPPGPKMIMVLFLGKAHLREALLMHEDALAVFKSSLEIRNKDPLLGILYHCHQRCLRKYEDVDQEDDFQVKTHFLYNVHLMNHNYRS